MSKKTMTKKQKWVYTEDGAELQEGSKRSIIKPASISKWYFFTPWIVWFVTLVYCFYLGGNWAVVGFLMIVFGPVPLTMLNIWTFKKLALKPLKSKK